MKSNCYFWTTGLLLAAMAVESVLSFNTRLLSQFSEEAEAAAANDENNNAMMLTLAARQLSDNYRKGMSGGKGGKGGSKEECIPIFPQGKMGSSGKMKAGKSYQRHHRQLDIFADEDKQAMMMMMKKKKDNINNKKI